jgi:AcrR family transcriptional regulator
MSPRENSKQRILQAASQLAQKQGSAHLSLDAVAAEAGISKGGLLYNFPNKIALLKALVEQFVEKSSSAFRAQLHRESGQSVPLEYFRMAVEELDRDSPPPSGILAALSEDPDLLAPIKHFNRELLDRLSVDEAGRADTLVAFLALEGLRAQRMFGVDALSSEERDLVLEKLKSMLGGS